MRLELQSIVDYTRAPDASIPDNIRPAIDPVLNITTAEFYFWSSTTHLDGPDASWAVYFSFGKAMGWMEQPPGSGNYDLLNVHGAGAFVHRCTYQCLFHKGVGMILKPQFIPNIIE